MIKASNIHKSYGTVSVLKGISLEVEKGEIVSLVGSSGAGKTTLLQILGTLEKPDQGQLEVNNRDVFKLNSKKLSDFRNKEIGFVFQFHHLLPEFSALENVCIPAFINGEKKKTVEERARKLLSDFGLSNRENHKPSELSGGEQQRVAIARALINDPALILMDEPTGNLDSETAQEIHEVILGLKKYGKKSFIIVTHNRELADLGDRIITIKDGEIVA